MGPDPLWLVSFLEETWAWTEGDNVETQGIDGVHEAWTHPSSGTLGKNQPCQLLGFQLSLPEPRERKKVKLLSLVRLLVTPWTVAHQDPLPKGFSRQDYWRGWPFPSPGDLPQPGIGPRSPAL